jgi:nucleoside phosphorylase
MDAELIAALIGQYRRISTLQRKLDLVQWHPATATILINLLGAEHPEVVAFSRLAGRTSSSNTQDYVAPALILLKKVISQVAPGDETLGPAASFRNIHIAIIAAKSVPELTQLLRISEEPWVDRTLPGSPSTYHVSRWRAQDGAQMNVVAVAPRSIGMTCAAIEATRLLHFCSPRYLALVGIAAGMKREWNTGDILFAQACFDYAAGKIRSSRRNAPVTFTPDGDGISIAPQLVEYARVVERDPALRLAIQEDSVEGNVRGAFPNIYIGPLASGPFVVASKFIKDMIGQQRRHVIGIDMESFAIAKAVDECARGRTEALVIKAVSDFADYTKSDDAQVRAAFFSARFLYRFAKQFLSPETGSKPNV